MWDHPAAVRLYMALAFDLEKRRYDAGLGLRELAKLTGRSLSTLTAVETGSTWPTWATMTAYAEHVGSRLVVPGSEDDAVPVALRARMTRRTGDAVSTVARHVGVSNTTLYGQFQPDGRPSSRIVLAVSCELGCPVVLIDAVSRERAVLSQEASPTAGTPPTTGVERHSDGGARAD